MLSATNPLYPLIVACFTLATPPVLAETDLLGFPSDTIPVDILETFEVYQIRELVMTIDHLRDHEIELTRAKYALEVVNASARLVNGSMFTNASAKVLSEESIMLFDQLIADTQRQRKELEDELMAIPEDRYQNAMQGFEYYLAAQAAETLATFYTASVDFDTIDPLCLD
jgi:hypothetical protein